MERAHGRFKRDIMPLSHGDHVPTATCVLYSLGKSNQHAMGRSGSDNGCAALHARWIVQDARPVYHIAHLCLYCPMAMHVVRGEFVHCGVWAVASQSCASEIRIPDVSTSSFLFSVAAERSRLFMCDQGALMNVACQQEPEN